LNDVNLHFFSLVNIDNTIYELDGRKSFPINHGPTSPESFLMDAVAVVRQFMDRDPANLNFSMCALAPAS
jgi:ubiquitin carboxyl-terminal hydrolase L3